MLDPEDEELPMGIHDTLNQLRQKLELVKSKTKSLPPRKSDRLTSMASATLAAT